MNREKAMILVVDDEPAVRDVLTLALLTSGWKTVEAANGEEAAEILRERGEEISGVITDLHMPGMDGLQLARRTRELFPKMPIVLSTGMVSDEQRTELSLLGNSEILLKPYSIAQLMGAVTIMGDHLAFAAAA
jgi:two-component system, cell cycle sensor histidine kinase and response regulator CckA